MNGKASLYSCVLSTVVVGWAAAGAAQEYAYEGGYIRSLEGSVSIQRATSPEPEEGEVNLPVLAGDRAWTGADSFMEVRFTDGSIVRLGPSTKVDFMDLGDEPNLRLWNGSVAVDSSDDAGRIRIDTPSGSLFPQTAGTWRADVSEGMTTSVSVDYGLVELASEQGSVVIGSGQQSTLEPGQAPLEPLAFDTTQSDALAAWQDTRTRRSPEPRTVPLAELPTEVHTYVDDLSDYGDWRSDEVHGVVWYPTSVGADWSPYRNGRWCYTSYGYTWVAAEPWGWGPHHYGRWGYNDYGWYWVPGRYWSPAWVSVAVGSFWVGWSPLGYYGGPVFAYGQSFYGGGRYPHHNQRYPYRYRRHGKAVPHHVYDHGAGWNYSRKDHFGRRGKARLRASDVRSSAGSARVHYQGAVFDQRLEPHALGRDNALARRAAGAPFARGRAVRRNEPTTRHRAYPRSGTTDRGVERILRGSVPNASTAARSSSGARTPSTRSRSRGFTAEATTTDSRARRRGRMSPRTSEPTRTAPGRTTPTRTRVRSRSRTFGAGADTSQPEDTSQPRTRGQEFFESSERRRAVTRSPERTTSRGRTRAPARSRGRDDSSRVTQPPPRSQRGASSSPESRRGRSGMQHRTPRSNRGTSGVRSGSRGSGRATPTMRSHGRRGGSGAARGSRSGSRGGRGRNR